MKKVTIGLSLAALAIGGIALAEQASSPVSGGPIRATPPSRARRCRPCRRDVRPDRRQPATARSIRRTARHAAPPCSTGSMPTTTARFREPNSLLGRPMRGRSRTAQMRGEGHGMRWHGWQAWAAVTARHGPDDDAHGGRQQGRRGHQGRIHRRSAPAFRPNGCQQGWPGHTRRAPGLASIDAPAHARP